MLSRPLLHPFCQDSRISCRYITSELGTCGLRRQEAEPPTSKPLGETNFWARGTKQQKTNKNISTPDLKTSHNHPQIPCREIAMLKITINHFLNSLDGFRHSSEKHPMDVNSEHSHYCFFSGKFCPPESNSRDVDYMRFCNVWIFVPGPEKLLRLQGRKFGCFVCLLVCFVAISC